MVLSMTGFASKTATFTLQDGSTINISIDLKTLNSRFFETTCKLSYPIQHLETELINRLKKKLLRGHAYLTIHILNPQVLRGAIKPSVKTIEGYLKLVDPSPAGFMIYTNTARPTGLDKRINVGAGECYAEHFTRDERYKNTVLQLGLYMVNDLEAINNGKRDKQIEKIGNWIKSADRPVYLRIGYEFDGPWNHYDPKAYVRAYRKIAGKLREMKVDNVSLVWSSAAVKPYKDTLKTKKAPPVKGVPLILCWHGQGFAPCMIVIGALQGVAKPYQAVIGHVIRPPVSTYSTTMPQKETPTLTRFFIGVGGTNIV